MRKKEEEREEEREEEDIKNKGHGFTCSHLENELLKGRQEKERTERKRKEGKI